MPVTGIMAVRPKRSHGIQNWGQKLNKRKGVVCLSLLDAGFRRVSDIRGLYGNG